MNKDSSFMVIFVEVFCDMLNYDTKSLSVGIHLWQVGPTLPERIKCD